MKHDSSSELATFCFSVIRVVPDPVRDEAANIGVVVADAQQPGGRMQLISRPISRVRRVSRGYSFEMLDRSLSDLAAALGTDTQAELGEPARLGASLELLGATAERLNNQLQLTRPQAYLATDVDDALTRLFRRYVAQRGRSVKRQEWLTRAILRDRIWRVVKEWEQQNLSVEQSGFLDGQTARHPADIVIRNGHPRVAIYALATHADDRNLAYFYRDSLPTIAQDMGQHFTVYAVLPPPTSLTDSAESEFREETRRLLETKDGVRAVSLDRLRDVRDQVEQLMF